MVFDYSYKNMAKEGEGMCKANSLEDLAKEFYRRGKHLRDFTTGNVGDILQVSENTVAKAYDNEWLGGFKVPGSRDRRIRVIDLVNSLKNKWGDFEREYPQRLILHMMEVLDLNPNEYGLGGFAGRGGIRFHVQEDLYTTSKTADFIACLSPATITRCVDNGTIGGYRCINSKLRRIPAGAIIRWARDGGVPLDESANELNSPELVTYAGNSRDSDGKIIGWREEDKVIYIRDDYEVWYRFEDKVHEFSIRQGEDYGLYVKFFEVEGREDPIIYLTLLGKARRSDEGGFLSREEHLGMVDKLLEEGKSLLRMYSSRSKGDKSLKAFKEVKDRFDTVYPAESYKYV